VPHASTRRIIRLGNFHIDGRRILRMDSGHNVPPDAVFLSIKESAMRRAGVSPAVLAVVLAALVMPLAASAGGADGKPSSGRHGHGFLPGYEPPEVVQMRRRFEYRGYWWGGPRFYRGRWNGGGFGPCWTQTPIGMHWNCG
jgi:hypothetical protein